NAAYFVVGALIITCIVMTAARAGVTSERRRWAILLWQGGWLVAAIVQFVCPTLLISGFAAAMGMVLIHAELENPNEGIDRTTGQFSANALISYVTDRYLHDMSFASMHVRLHFLSRNVDLETIQTVLLRCANFLAQSSTVKVFRLTDDTFVVLMKNADELEKEYQRISDGIEAAVGLPLEYSYIRMPDSDIVNSAEEYFRLHHYYDNLFTGRISEVVDKAAVERLRRYDRVQELVRSALDDGRVEVYFQPFYEVATKRYTSAEALVRINDRDGTVINPGEFINIAEENGLIVPLGIEIFRQVCEFLSDGRAEEAGLRSVEVNISVAQFDRENPAEFVMRLLDIYHLKPGLINLEITETASSMARQLLVSNMERLREIGVSFSLDDFGTGRSNLDYFVEMPVERVKFDYSLTQQYLDNDRAHCVIESVVEMVHHMGLSVVSEGVETQEQLDAMCGLGVEFIQGFYFSKPLKREEFIAFLREKNGKGNAG
ncbi:MAG: EAL domain-containing protein, partial [Lachnospiraceae bacterium]|nr:EAL domain-containing protein [Lachnospiraceae bacterium]